MAFRDPSFYDSPGMLAQQALGGNLAPVDTFLNPEGLSPSQRRSLYEAATGGGLGNRFVDTLGEIVTNPFTYLALLTGPVGTAALKAGKPLLEMARSKNPIVKQSLGYLEKMGFFSPVEMVGPQGEKIISSIAKTQEAVRSNVALLNAMSTKPLLDGLSKKFGRTVTSLNPADYADVAERRFMEELTAALAAKAHGLDRSQLRSYQQYLPEEFAIFNKKGKRIDTKRLLGEPTDSPAIRMKQAEDLAADMRRQRNEAWNSLTEQRRHQEAMSESDEELEEWMKNVYGPEVRRINNDMGFEVRAVGSVKRVGDKVQEALVDRATLDEFLGSVEGADRYLDGFKKQRDFELVMMLGDEADMLVKNADGTTTVRDWGSDNFKFDDDKVRRYLDYRRNVDIRMNKDKDDLVGEDLVDLIANDKAPISTISHKDPGRDVEAFKNVYRGELKDTLANGGFAPRNVYDVEDAFEGVMSKPSDVPLMGERYEFLGARRAFQSLRKDAPVTVKERTSPGLERDSIEGVIRTGRLMPRSNLVPQYSTRDLEILSRIEGTSGRNLLTQAGAEHGLEVQRQAVNKLKSSIDKNVDPQLRTISLNLERSGTRAVKEASNVSSYVTHKSGVQVLKSEMPTNFDTKGGPATRGKRVPLLDKAGKPIFDENGEQIFKTQDRDPLALIEEGDSNWRALTALRNGASRVRQGIIDDLIVPVVTGSADEQTAALVSSTFQQKRIMKWLSDSWIGKTMEKYGGKHGKDLVNSMRWFGSEDSMPSLKSTMSERLSSYLYVSHMGLNLSSVAINILQPLTNAASIASPGQIVKAYGKALKSVFGYAADRAKMGFRFASHTERNELIKKHFAWGDEIGLTADFMKMIEADHLGKTGGVWDRVSRFSMSLFEKSEWFNRSVTANLLEDAYRAAGRTPGLDKNWSFDLRGFINRTQFTSENPLYRPAIFGRARTVSEKTWAGTLSNPLLRMFMQFPLRTATTFFKSAPTWGGEENYAKGLMRHAFKTMGYGAILHETTRGLFGADLTRGLPATGVTDIIGGRKMLYEDQWYPVPPIARLPVSVMKGVMGDSAELTQALAALIPGGMAVSKALSIAPQLPSLGGGLLQRTYADYSSIQQDGTVPIYKQDGTLVGYQKPSEIVLKGLGLDLGSGQTQGKIDGYLIKQRQEIIRHRHEFLRKLAGNDVSGAEAVRRDFSAKYKDPETGAPLPLTVTQAQVKQYLRSRDNIGRTERILDSLSPDVRMQMANAIGASVGAGADLSSGMTAAQRERYNPTSRDERVQEIWGNVQSVGAAATADSGPVGPAATFTQGQ